MTINRSKSGSSNISKSDNFNISKSDNFPMNKSFSQSKSANQKQIKALISKVSSGRSTAIDRNLVDQCINYAKNPNDTACVFQTIFDEVDKNASHQFAINKLLYILQSIANLRDPQINTLLRQHLAELHSITMLSFEDKKATLRKNIHQSAQSLFDFIANDKQFNDEAFNVATHMTFVKPISEEPKPSQPTYDGGLIWMDNSDDEVQKPESQPQSQESPKNVNDEHQNAEEEPQLGPDPFDDFVGYDPFENFVVPENFSTKLELKSNQSVSLTF